MFQYVVRGREQNTKNQNIQKHKREREREREREMSGDVEDDVIDLVSENDELGYDDDDLFSQEEMESLKALEAIETIERNFYAKKKEKEGKEEGSERDQRVERRRAKMILRQKIDEQRRILSAIVKTKSSEKKRKRTPKSIEKIIKRSSSETKSQSPVQNCCVCLTEPVNVTLRPCGHHLCRICAGKVSDCPLCRVKISKLSPGLMALDAEEVAKLKRKQTQRPRMKLSLTNKGKKRKKQRGNKMGNIQSFFRRN